MQSITQVAQLYSEMKIASDTTIQPPLDSNMTIKSNYKPYDSTCINDEIINYSYENRVEPSITKELMAVNNAHRPDINLFFSKCTE